MAHYNKGASAERELLLKLWKLGFAVMRSAGSGKMALPTPDVIALSKDKKVAFECKFWSSKNLTVSKQQMNELIEWGDKGSTDVFVAWKIPNKGWRFLKPHNFKETNKNFSITLAKAMKYPSSLELIMNLQSTLQK